MSMLADIAEFAPLVMIVLGLIKILAARPGYKKILKAQHDYEEVKRKAFDN